MKNETQYNLDQIISRSQFRELTGMSRSTEWRLYRSGRLPSAIRVNGRVLGYLNSNYEEWIKKHTDRGGKK